MYVITGATGHTGQVVAEKLLAAGKEVKAISRSRENLQALEEKGAVATVGDLQDQAFMEEAFKDAEGVYAMIPPKFDAEDFRNYQKEVAENITQAVQKHQVPYVVTLSSYGAHNEQGAGVVSGLYPLEQKLNALEGINVTHIRAGYFYENFFASIPVIKQQGVLGGFPIRGDVEMAMVHTRDIGSVAADLLLNKDFSGKQVIYLGHEKLYSLNEAAAILGKAIGKEDLGYVAFPSEGAKQAMVGMGMSESLAENYVEFSEAASAGKLYEDDGAGKFVHSPTSLEEFSKTFAGAYQAS